MNKKNGILIGIVVIVLVVVAVLLFGNRGAAPQTPAPQQAQTTQNAEPQPSQPAAAGTGLYTSADDGFSVDFPALPKATKSTFRSLSAGSIPLTRYMSGSSEKYYVIDVYHYPATYKFSATYLSDALRLFVMAVNSKYPGTKLVSQTPGQFQGGTSLSATLTVPEGGGQQGSGYLLITIKGQNAYSIGTFGLSKGSYDSFVNSFTFTK